MEVYKYSKYLGLFNKVNFVSHQYEDINNHHYYYWEVGMVVGKSVTQNKMWYNDHINYRATKSTGNCGLEAILFGLQIVKTLKGKTVLIGWSDSKREKAYSYLERYGFVKRVFKKDRSWKFYLIFPNEWTI